MDVFIQVESCKFLSSTPNMEELYR